jgi:hypothetical protein
MKIKIVIGIFILIVLYGFYEKDRRETLYKDFRANKAIICNDKIIRKGQGWRILNNRFFINGSESKTVIFCKSLNK